MREGGARLLYNNIREDYGKKKKKKNKHREERGNYNAGNTCVECPHSCVC